MEKIEIHNLVNFYLDFKREDVEENRQYLKDAGIDAESFRDKMLKVIAKERGKLKIEKGKRFAEEAKRILSGKFKLPESINTDDLVLNSAFSKLKNSLDAEKEDILSDEEIVKLLEYFRNEE